MVPARPTFQAVVDQACRTTTAATGWLLFVESEGLRVAATAGSASGRGLEGRLLVPSAAQRYALSSHQPAALLPQPGDPGSQGAAGHPGVPSALLIVPCGTDPVSAVLEVAAKRGDQPFDLDDMARVSMLAAVAAAAAGEEVTGEAETMDPSALSDHIHDLARRDPGRYRETARLIAALLAASQ